MLIRTGRLMWWLAWFSSCWSFGHAGAQAQDSWLGADKGKHFAASAVLAVGGYAGSLLLVDQPWQSAAIGGGFAFGLGVAKELYDAMGHGDPSFRDLTWDLIGCAFGVGISLLVDYALREPATEPRPPQVQARIRGVAW